jgi:CheY-like chemotaxis protein
MSDIKALIIEDNTNDASVLQKLLTKLEISYTTLFDSRTFSVELMEVERPDVVFLDLEIPGTSGFEVLSIIQSIPEFEGIPVIAYTANSAEMGNARNAGFHSFLGKPLRSATFPDQLERILSGDSVWEVR